MAIGVQEIGDGLRWTDGTKWAEVYLWTEAQSDGGGESTTRGGHVAVFCAWRRLGFLTAQCMDWAFL